MKFLNASLTNHLKYDIVGKVVIWYYHYTMKHMKKQCSGRHFGKSVRRKPRDSAFSTKGV